ncbi:MAG: type VI secretion system contractile sheath large subunit [Gammaproteobacteria bacterium]|nr:type VI secretion system contractile sheath large subunit [Gammaproteobacteria bacterium]
MAQKAAIKNQDTTLQTSLLEQAIGATKQTERSRAQELITALVDECLAGTVTWNKSLVTTIEQAIMRLDQNLSKQLATVMHNESFKQLEGSWRGLDYLVKNTSTSGTMRIRMLQASKRELYKEMDKAPDYDQSVLFKQIYDSEFGMAGGEPYGLLIGDYQFTNSNEDMELIRKVSNVAAAAFCPFVTAADSSLLGLNSWNELSNPRDLEKVHTSQEFAKWRGFRETEDSRFVTMAMPRVLARLPYGAATRPAETFNYEETPTQDKTTEKMPHDDYCWMNAAYVLGQRITNAMTKYNWATAIRGAEGGGKVENLPLHTFTSDEGDIDAQCPTEIGITDRREAELSKLGFLPLCHYKNTDYAVFFGAQTAQKPKKYDTSDASANAEISARLPYILATSRFAHYLKVMARDKIGSFMEVSDCETWLNKWIAQYVNANTAANHELKAKYPLAAARVEVKEVAGKPGSYNAVAYLRPWLQFEELTASMRLVAQIPQLKK